MAWWWILGGIGAVIAAYMLFTNKHVRHITLGDAILLLGSIAGGPFTFIITLIMFAIHDETVIWRKK